MQTLGAVAGAWPVSWVCGNYYTRVPLIDGLGHATLSATYMYMYMYLSASLQASCVIMSGFKATLDLGHITP